MPAAGTFERGFVPYTDGAKHEMLGVDADLLARVGAVSKEVAEAMATGALAASKAEVALSITGYADKNGDGAPGLVFFGLASGGAATSVEERHFGDIGCAAVRIACLSTGLMLIGKRIGALHPRPR